MVGQVQRIDFGQPEKKGHWSVYVIYRSVGDIIILVLLRWGTVLDVFVHV